MEIVYKRMYDECYMVIETEELPQDGYEEQMMRQNQICCLLSCYTLEINNRIQFWYRITGKESLEDYFRREGVTLEAVERVIRSLEQACSEIQKYLLRQSRICLLPQTVYLQQEKNELQMFLCYCPMEMESIYCQFHDIMEFVLTQIREQQEEAVVCYRLYDITGKDNYRFSQLLDCISESRQTLEASCGSEEEDQQIKEIPQELPLLETEIRTVGTRPKRVCRTARKEPEWWKSIREKIKQEAESVRDLFPVLASPERREIGEQKSILKYQGREDEQDYVITKKVFLIGSFLEENDACLHSATVSQCHARIFLMDGQYYLEDLCSRNGTFLNGERMEPQVQKMLHTLDQICFGEVEYIFYE